MGLAEMGAMGALAAMPIFKNQLAARAAEAVMVELHL